MSSSLCGYFLYWPKKSGMKVTAEHLAKIKACFEPNSVKLIKQLANDTDPINEPNRKVLDALSELGVSTEDYKQDNYQLSDDENEWTPEQMEEFLEQIKSDAEEFDECFTFDYQDTNSSIITVNGCKVEVFFAGGDSSGEEPEGGGYDQIKKMVRLGVFDALYKSIPWDKRPPQKPLAVKAKVARTQGRNHRK